MFTHAGELVQRFNMSVTPVDLSKIDIKSFARELDELRQQTLSQLSHEDLEHLKRLEKRGRISFWVGLLTGALLWNIISALLISFGLVTRWMVAHHVLHKGYDKVPDVPKRYTSGHFARGWRRFVDWFDWIYPEGWEHEHNILHHYDTGGRTDPDCVELHMEFLRKSSKPKLLKYLYVLVLACTWKWSYYAPQTMTVLTPKKVTRKTYPEMKRVTYRKLFKFEHPVIKELWLKCYLPFGLVHFVLLPLLFMPLGFQAVTNVFITRCLAEALTNIHTFMVIGPNHSGDDLYRFEEHFSNKEEFYLTQVLGSVNFKTGGDWNDHLHKWLNYQIEHHLFPDLPLRQYALIQPRVKEICIRHGVPYVQEGVLSRVKKLVDICVGNTSMQQLTSLKPVR